MGTSTETQACGETACKGEKGWLSFHFSMDLELLPITNLLKISHFSQLQMEFLEPLGCLFCNMWRGDKNPVKICEPAISERWIVQWEISRDPILRRCSMQ